MWASVNLSRLPTDFQGGTLSSDSGVLWRRGCEALLRRRICQLACGYEDANDCNTLRHDPAIQAACGRLPIEGDSLASQPSVNLEDARTRPLGDPLCKYDMM
jgi:hypothetical protein